jgi:serine/threonine-protein kinase
MFERLSRGDAVDSMGTSAQGAPQLPQPPQLPGTLQAVLGSHYALERELGRGGMATVYLARDLRHRRPVAIKLLHPEFSAVLGPERFLREIELTASLQHPHVLPLFDSGTAGGLLYYVMPYVEGESLRQRLDRERQLPVSEAVRITREVADALQYAHDRGVVHRDVKPENVMLQGAIGGYDAHALVADFGIALAVEQAGGTRMTQTGLSLGTPQYMAPEQAAGERTVDARADVYALGAMLYEMLAGEPPFTGPTTQAVIARVLTEEPRSLTVQRASVPQHVDAAVRTALAKLPADRFRSAEAFSTALATSPAAGGYVSHTRRGRPWRAVPIVIAGTGIVATVAIAWALGRASSAWSAWSASQTSTSPRGAVRFVIGADSAVARFSELAVSPDGRSVVYSGEGADGSQLYVRTLEETAARPLAGTEDGDWPFFSPDGKWVAFFSHAALRKARLDGSEAALVAPIRSASFGGGSWGEDGTILYALAPSGALYRVPASGGTGSRVRIADTTLWVMHPHWLPGGRAALVSVTRDYGDARIGVLDLGNGRVRQFAAGIGPRLVAGHLVFAADGTLYRQPFDVERREPTGSAEQIATGLETFYVDQSAWWIPRPAFGLSANGTLAYRVGGLLNEQVMGDTRLVVTDRDGREQQVIPARSPWAPRFSPDGGRVVYAARVTGNDAHDVWVTDLETRATQRVTGGAGEKNNPVWRPDGNAVAYHTPAPRGADIALHSLDVGHVLPLVQRPGSQHPNDWAADGTLLFDDMVIEGDDAGAQDIWIQPAGGGAARTYVATPAHERGARASPDGRWVVYQSDETGRVEVYVQSYPLPGAKIPVSVDGGTNPVWRGDGREIYYWKGDQLIAASVTADGTGKSLIVRSRAPLFRAPYVGSLGANYDVSRDGSRFILVTGRPQANRLVVALGTP